MILPPPELEDITAGTRLRAGMGESTILADMDFETYSPAGYVWDKTTNKFESPPGANTKGLPAIGAAKYTEHPDAEVLCLAYNLKNGDGPKLWKPGDKLPQNLFNHIISGQLIEAWNVSFEYWVWTNICVKKYNFPLLSSKQLRCAAAKSRAYALPPSLDKAGATLDIKNKKDKDGFRLLTKFSMPRNPTKKDTRTRIRVEEEKEEAQRLYNYCLTDILAESELSSLIPDLTEHEEKFRMIDHAINIRGVCIDIPLIQSSIKIIEKAYNKYNAELRRITGGDVTSASKIQELTKWLLRRGVLVTDLQAETITELLKTPEVLPPDAKRALQIRQLIGSAAVKKLYSMLNQVTNDGRLHDLFMYHAARTGRASGQGPQPQNLPNHGPDVVLCQCNKRYLTTACPWCGSTKAIKKEEWGPNAVQDVITTLKTESLECVEYHFGDAVEVVSGSLRGMFIAAPGHDLICSDYSAIEAVVLAALAGEEWRLDVFRTHGKIYETSASKITGVPFEEFELYKATSGSHHPLRKKVGKVAELASGYGGWVGAWKNFHADEYFPNDDEIVNAILAWRDASPAIVEFWGGQEKHWKKQYYGLEGAAIQAVLNPNQTFTYRDISYIKYGDALYCKLPSGRYITYHRPRLTPSIRKNKSHLLDLSFEGWNSNPKNGVIGWTRMNTYSGKLAENVVQAVARDILAHAIVNLEEMGYPVVLHVHDEIVSEVPEGYGSVEEFEYIMSDMPAWAKDWPLKVQGGWRAKRYTK